MGLRRRASRGMAASALYTCSALGLFRHCHPLFSACLGPEVPPVGPQEKVLDLEGKPIPSSGAEPRPTAIKSDDTIQSLVHKSWQLW